MPTRLLAVALLVLLAGGGCASSRDLSQPPSRYGASTAEASVRGFLDAIRAEDYAAMARYFGTRDGPAERELGLAQVEQRMVVLGRMLQHRSHELRRESAGVLGPERTRFVAVLRGTREGTIRIPLISVSTPDGRWFVERVVVDEMQTQPD